jgi:hypothetical protein
MNTFLRVSLFYLALLLLEMVVCFVCLLFVSPFKYQASIDSAILWTFWRVLFYGIPSLLVFWACYRSSSRWRPNRRLWLFSAVNVLCYVALSRASESVWKNVPLPAEGVMFVVTCIALVFSPLLIGQIPFFRQQLGSLPN